MLELVDEALLLALKENLEKCDNLRQSILAEIKYQESLTVVECSKDSYGKGCGAKYNIKNISYIQTHWYESPYSCSSGDQWHQGDGEWECPCCGKRNRLYTRPEIEAMKYLFREIVNEHKD